MTACRHILDLPEHCGEDEDGPRSVQERSSERLFILVQYLVDDFVCALRRRVLYQGRIYVFEHYACFVSRIFNLEKILVIPLKDVTSIRKKKMYGFPNSVEVAWKGKKEFFASFLKRDAAYRLLTYAWSKSSPYAKLFGGISEDGSEPPSSPRTSPVSESKKLLGIHKLAKLVHRKDGSQKRMAANGDGVSSQEQEDDKMFQTGRHELEMASVSEAASHISDSDDESESAEGLENWVPSAEEAPSVSLSSTVISESTFELSVQDFYKEFLSEQSQFLITWHESRGDTKVQISEWHKHTVGHVRELSFITPLKQRIGPSKCLCTQTQRARLHVDDHLVFETSQIMDIPYGDHFSVEMRWDITPALEGKGCKVEVRLSIPFSKKTIFRSTIESSTKQLVTEACEDWLATAHRWLEPPIPIRSAFDVASKEEKEDSDYHEPTHFSRSQSLALRLSQDHGPGVELLLRAPSAHRSDIARMLQLQRREIERKRSSLGRMRYKSVSFDLSPDLQPKQFWERVREQPFLHRTPVLIALLLVLLSAWIWWYGLRWNLLPSFGWLSGKVWLPRADGGCEKAGVTERMEAMQRSLEELQTQFLALSRRLELCETRV